MADPLPPSNPAPTPPQIFSSRRRNARRQRMRHLQSAPDAPRFLAEDMAEDVLERLAFLRHEPQRALVIGDRDNLLAPALAARGTVVVRADPAPGEDENPIVEEQPFPATGPLAQPFDLIVSLGLLDTVNDLPGALIHLRRALAPEGLAIVSMMGAGSLDTLRAIMAEADGDRAAPRVHPQVDVRAGGQLLQRSGFADPVVDSRSLNVRYRSFERLIGDLRAQALNGCLANPGPNLTRSALERAKAAFTARQHEGRVTERFEILTLSGWARALRPAKF